MHERIIPKELHARALALYTQGGDGDERSALYAQADERVANGISPLRRAGTKRPANWAAGLHKYEDFWREYCRRPREHTRNGATLRPGESRMGAWATYQRKFEDNLCRYQKIRLDISPAFDWDIHDGDWQRTFDGWISQGQKTGRRPYLNGSDEIEFGRARWHNRQLRQLQDGTLSASRAKRIAETLRSA